MTNFESLTADQIKAIREYAAIYGRTWKQSLRDDWMAARTIGTIHALRNSHGPAWLNIERRTFTPLGDCQACDGYVLDASEAPFCPSCYRERNTASGERERSAK